MYVIRVLLFLSLFIYVWWYIFLWLRLLFATKHIMTANVWPYMWWRQFTTVSKITRKQRRQETDNTGNAKSAQSTSSLRCWLWLIIVCFFVCMRKCKYVHCSNIFYNGLAKQKKKKQNERERERKLQSHCCINHKLYVNVHKRDWVFSTILSSRYHWLILIHPYSYFSHWICDVIKIRI